MIHIERRGLGISDVLVLLAAISMCLILAGLSKRVEVMDQAREQRIAQQIDRYNRLSLELFWRERRAVDSDQRLFCMMSNLYMMVQFQMPAQPAGTVTPPEPVPIPPVGPYPFVDKADPMPTNTGGSVLYWMQNAGKFDAGLQQ